MNLQERQSVEAHSASTLECSMTRGRLRNATVSSIHTAGGPKSRSRTGETVKLSYESIEWTYVTIDSTTGRVTSAAAAQWDLPAEEGQQGKR